MTNWNEDSSNRSKDVQLFEELNDVKKQMMVNLELSIERGERTDALLEKTETLVETSINYKATAKKVK